MLNNENLISFFPDTDANDLTDIEVRFSGEDFVIVTERGEEDGGQHLFSKEADGQFRYLGSDTIVDLQYLFGSLLGIERYSMGSRGSCNSSDLSDHEKVFAFCKDAVGNFSSSSGPDGGNLACVWAVRRLIAQALGRKVHQSDLTTTFERELDDCFPNGLSHADLPAGAIVISPTKFSLVNGVSHRVGTGHVGILGEGSGDDRLVYSNSSGKANWDQNFTVGRWKERYSEKKGLPTKYYPIPLYSSSLPAA